MSDFVATIGPGIRLLPGYQLSQIQGVVPSVPSCAFAYDAGQWYLHPGGIQNNWVPIGNPTTTPGQPSKVTLAPNAMSLAVGSTSPIVATTFDQNNNALGSRTYAAVSDNTLVATVTISGAVATVTGVANGTCNIKITDNAAAISSFCVVTVVTAGSHEPGGTTVIINGGDITTPPATVQNGTWVQNGVTWSMFSPSGNFNSTTDDASRLTIDASGHGWRYTYPTSLTGGNATVRFGTSIGSPGTGTLYVKRTVQFSSVWTTGVSTGIKNAEPHTSTAGSGAGATENHILYFSYNGTNNGSQLQPMVQLQGPNSQARNLVAPNGTQGILTGGGVHTLEELLIQEATPGQATGSYQAWVDGALLNNYSNVNYLASGQGKGWFYFLRDTVWGGGGSNPAQQQYWIENFLYVSVK